MMVVAGKDKTDGTKEEEKHQGRTRKEGARITTSKNSRVGFVAVAVRVPRTDCASFSRARASRFFPVATQHKYPKTCKLLAVQFYVLASSRLAAEHTRACGAAQHSLSSNTPSQRITTHHTMFPLFYPVRSALYRNHKNSRNTCPEHENGTKRRENTPHCRPIYPYTCTNTYTINRTPSLVRKPRH